MKKITLLLFLCISFHTIAEQSLFTKANTAYASDSITEAIALYDSILASGKESSELYAEAVKPDKALLDKDGQLCYRAFGPTATPPIRASADSANEDHLVDGYYEEATKKYAVQYADTKAFMTKLLAASHKRRMAKKYDADE